MSSGAPGRHVPFLPALVGVVVALTAWLGGWVLAGALGLLLLALGASWIAWLRQHASPTEPHGFDPLACDDAGGPLRGRPLPHLPAARLPRRGGAHHVRGDRGLRARGRRLARESRRPRRAHAPRRLLPAGLLRDPRRSAAARAPTPCPDPAEALRAFTDLYAAASASDGDEVYARQQALVRIHRQRRTPFQAQLPERHGTRCRACGERMLDGLGYLEDPRQTATPPTEAALPFGEPRGRHFATRRAPLHGVVAHGRPPPPELARLLLAWPRSRSAP